MNKLQELTDKLYNEGLSKGKQEAEDLLAKARAEASSIIEKANAEAASIIADAGRKAEELRSTAVSDLQMASRQTVTALKQKVEQAVTAKMVSSPLTRSFSDPDFVKGLIATIVSAFDAANPESVALEVLLPEEMKAGIEKSLAGEINSVLSDGVEVKYVKGLPNGFRIGPKDGGYIINFTEDEFSAMIGEYLRPATRKILFSE